jgi:uncharacterized protein YcbX
MHVVDIAIFPVKSGRGISVAEAEVEPRGLKGDRRWMLVDPSGRFVSQRELPPLARLGAELTASGLRLSCDAAAIEVARPAPGAVRFPVSVWDSKLELPEAPEAREWLSARFGQPLRLVFQPEDTRRPTDDWAGSEDEVSLADGYPLLIATRSSLEALRNEAGGGLGMERFRPSLVIDGPSAWAEDSWGRIRVGNVELELVKPCPRCTVTTVDQFAGAFAGDEPLSALRRIRMSGDRRVPGVLFGWNAVPRRLGTVRLGDPVEVLAEREPWAIRDRSAGQGLAGASSAG